MERKKRNRKRFWIIVLICVIMIPLLLIGSYVLYRYIFLKTYDPLPEIGERWRIEFPDSIRREFYSHDSDFHGGGTFYVFCSVSEEPVEFLATFENGVNEKIEELRLLACGSGTIFGKLGREYIWRIIPHIGGSNVRYMAYFPEISIMLIYDSYGT